MRLSLLALIGLLLTGPANAQAEAAGKFDYDLLVLTWAPNWCALTGDSRDAPEFQPQGRTFTLHGLWPQHDAGGSPSDCRTTASDPTRRDTAAMTDIMGSAGLARHEWQGAWPLFGIIGAAFTAIVGSPVADLINPIIGLILGGVNFFNLYFVLNGTA